MIIVLKICLIISQHLARYRQKKKALIIILVGDQKGYIVLVFLTTNCFLHSIKPFRNKMGTKLDRHLLDVEQNKYATEIVNAYIVNGLDTWSNNPFITFALKVYIACLKKQI